MHDAMNIAIVSSSDLDLCPTVRVRYACMYCTLDGPGKKLIIQLGYTPVHAIFHI